MPARPTRSAVADLAEQADVVVLVETTPARCADQVGGQGWDAGSRTRSGTRGRGQQHRGLLPVPVGRRHRARRSNFSQWSVAVEVPDVGLVRLLAVHPCNPYCGGGRWPTEHEVLPAAVAHHGRAAGGGGGLQRRRRAGADAAAAPTRAAQRHRSGRGGLAADLPAGGRLPPLLPIDHVLVNGRLTATSVRTFAVDDTDHLGLITTLAGTR